MLQERSWKIDLIYCLFGSGLQYMVMSISERVVVLNFRTCRGVKFYEVHEFLRAAGFIVVVVMGSGDLSHSFSASNSVRIYAILTLNYTVT
jgi:hypothetical protein